MTFTTYKPKNYLPHIDGLRGIAVLAVVLFHLDFTVFQGGFVGVDIFFVISGYLITGIIVRDVQKDDFSFARFYARRIRRIFPALFFVLFGTIILAIFFSGPVQFSDTLKSVRMASAQISNFYFARELDYFALDQTFAPLLHTWSLGVEEQFYLIWPLLLVGINRFFGMQRAFVILCGIMFISLGISEYLVRTNAMHAFYHLHSRAWELAMGGVLALNAIPALKHQKWREVLGFAGLLLIGGSALLIDENGFPGLKAVPPCLGAALFIYAVHSGECRAQKILSLKPLVFCGLISYSLYLWHWPFIAFYKGYFGETLRFSVQLGIAVLSFAFATFSYRFVEQPFRVMQIGPKKAIAAGLCMILVFILGANVLKNYNRASWRLAHAQEDAVTEPHKLFKVCSIATGPFDKKNCYIGPNKDSYEVILAGDSFASHFAPMVIGWAKKRGLTVRLFTRGACQIWVKKDGVKIRNGKVDQDCMDLRPAFYDALENDKSIQYVFLGRRKTDFNEDVIRSLDDVLSYNKKTYFLGVGPLFKEHPHNCDIKNNLLISKIFPRPEQQNDCLKIDTVQTQEMLSELNQGFKPHLEKLNIPYFDPNAYISSPFNDEGNFLFMDAGHMNEYGGLYLIPYFEDFMKEHGEP